jgi:ribonuclease P protein component
MLPSPPSSGGNADSNSSTSRTPIERTLPNHSLSKREILRRKKDIDDVFEHGKSLREPFLKVMFRTATRDPSEPIVVALFAVSKRSVKKAAHRNRVKRLLREAYRLNKQPLLEQLHSRLSKETKVNVVFLYQPHRDNVLTLASATLSLQNAFKKMTEMILRQNNATSTSEKAKDDMTKQRFEATAHDYDEIP